MSLKRVRGVVGVACLTAVVGLALPACSLADVSAGLPSSSATLAAVLAGRGVQIENLTYPVDPTNSDKQPVGLYSGGTWQPGFASGVIVSSGNYKLVYGPSTPDYFAANDVDNGGGSDPDLNYPLPNLPHQDPKDSAAIEFDATPAGPRLVIPFVFGSEEYSNPGNNRYIDRMGIFVGGNQCAFTSAGLPITTRTFDATTPAGNTLYVDNSTPQPGTPGMTGLSRPMSCSVPVTPGKPVHVKLAVADGQDTASDSGVLFPTHGIVSNRPPVAHLSAPATITAGRPAAFSTHGSGDPDGALASWSLHFGDGSAASGKGAPPATLSHTFPAGSFSATLKVTDADGLSASSSASFAAAPQTTIRKHPKAKLRTRKKRLKVSFKLASVRGAAFQCKLDKGTFVPCKAAVTYKVKPGHHTFAARAIANGIPDPTPATFSFAVKKQKHKKK